MTTATISDREHALYLHHLGHSPAEVARMVGRPSSTVSAWLDPDWKQKQIERRKRYRRPCPRCGTKMDGSGGYKSQPKLCTDCNRDAQHEHRYWTQETVIEAIQRWALTHDGVPPSATMWLRKTPKGVPSVAVVMREFGSWADAIEAAGFARPRTGHYDRSGTKGLGPMARDVLDLLALQGPMTTPEISAALRVRTCHHSLDRLSHRGLVEHEGRGVTHYPFIWRLA